MSIVERKADLFQVDSDSKHTSSLAHCVSQDLHMGRGIAVKFKKKFGRIDELIAQNKQVGQVAVLKDKDREKRFVYYMITKEKYWQKPLYKDLEACMVEIRQHCQDEGVTQLLMPRIACGLDSLEWSTVRQLLTKVFGKTDIKLTICYY